jgi:hypothetical protein
MHLVLYIGLGVGLSAAAGVRPFLPALLAGGLGAAGALGVGFGHGGYHFLQSGWWLVVVAAAFVASWLVQLRVGSVRLEEGPAGTLLAALGLAIGALLFAGTLAEHGDASWPGLIGGAICALLAVAAVRPVAAGARARLTDRPAREAVTLYLDGTALLASALACLLHVLGYLTLVLLAWLLIGTRRNAARKYAGLRILGR